MPNGIPYLIVRINLFLLDIQIDASNQPAAWLFYEAVVMIAYVEEVVGLGIDLPVGFRPSQAGIGQEVGLVVVHVAVEVCV